MKYLISAIIEKLIGNPVNAYLNKKAAEKEKKLDENEFAAYYEQRRVALCVIALLGCIGVTLGFYFVDKTIDVVVKVCSAFSVIVFLVVFYLATYRCYVDDAGFTVKKFFVFKKFIPKEEFVHVCYFKRNSGDKRNHKNKEEFFVIRNRTGKSVFSASEELVGFNLMVKRAIKFQRNNNK